MLIGSIELNKTNIEPHPDCDKRNTNKKNITEQKKPVKLLIKLIDGLTKEKCNGFRLFYGSGSTAIVCLETKRNYIGFELDKVIMKLHKIVFLLCAVFFQILFQTELSNEAGT